MPPSAPLALRALASAALLSSALALAAAPKHVVVIVVDDLGSADLGFTGSQIATPNIDAMAASGVRLGSFYVQRACSPTRAALMTGRYNIRYGFESGVLEDNNGYALPINETLLPTFVKATTRAKAHMVGKWCVLRASLVRSAVAGSSACACACARVRLRASERTRACVCACVRARVRALTVGCAPPPRP